MVNPDQLKIFLIVICKSAMTKKWLNMARSLIRIDFNSFRPSSLTQGKFTINSPSHEEDFDDVGCNADLYASRQDAFQGLSRGSDERSQQLSDPHCFQSLSLD